MPDILEPYHGDEPFSPRPDPPWVDLGSDQIRRIAEITQDHRGSVRLEYRGATYWSVRLLDAEGQPIDEKIIWPIEPEHRR